MCSIDNGRKSFWYPKPVDSQLISSISDSLILRIINWFVKGRKLSPTAPSSRLSLEAPLEKDEGISDEEDPAELRVLLELNEQVPDQWPIVIFRWKRNFKNSFNEQESSQLRRKVEELESNNETSKKQIKELQDKLKQSTGKQQQTTTKLPTFLSKTGAADKESDKKLKDLEKNVTDLKKQILEKDKTIEKLQSTPSKATKAK